MIQPTPVVPILLLHIDIQLLMYFLFLHYIWNASYLSILLSPQKVNSPVHFFFITMFVNTMGAYCFLLLGRVLLDNHFTSVTKVCSSQGTYYVSVFLFECLEIIYQVVSLSPSARKRTSLLFSCKSILLKQMVHQFVPTVFLLYSKPSI